MNGEKVIDLLWEVKEGKKHPNKAYQELCVLFDVVGQIEQFYCSDSDDGQYKRCETQCFRCAGLEEQSKQ